MNLYQTDLFEITVTAACLPRNGHLLRFVEAAPNKHEVIRAIEMEIDELRRDAKIAEGEDDECALDQATDDIESAYRSIEVIKAIDVDVFSFVGIKLVLVAGTPIGTVKIETRDVWKNH